MASTIITIGLMVNRPQPLIAQAGSAVRVAANAQSFQIKLGELEQAHQNGRSGAEARLSSDEVAAALTAQPASAGASTSADPVPLKDLQVVFERDEVKGQFTTEVAGKDVVITLTGHVASKDGYVDFVPTSFYIGSMPVPISLVQDQLRKKLADPETRDKLKLPEFVSDLRIENGQLLITEK